MHPVDAGVVHNDRKHGELKLEYRFKPKDGQYRWLADRAVMMKDESGRIRAGFERHLSKPSSEKIEELLGGTPTSAEGSSRSTT